MEEKEQEKKEERGQFIPSNDKLNFSVSSWDGDPEIYSPVNMEKLKVTEEIKGGQDHGKNGMYGDKYICTNNGKNKYFAKNVIEYNCIEIDAADNLLETALSSAFISCFSHTPYPVGIKTIKGQKNIVFRYNKNTLQTTQAEDDWLNLFIFVTEAQEIKKAFVQLNIQYNKLSIAVKKIIIQLFIHVFFFGLDDRKRDNLILSINGMHHVDVDRFGQFMFQNNEKQKIAYEKIKTMLPLLKGDENTITTITTIFNNTINKILQIDYKKFVDRFIRNSIVLGIKQQDAFQYLQNFVNKMNNFNTTVLGFINNDKNMEIAKNKYWQLLEEGFKKHTQNVEENKFLQAFSNMNNNEEAMATFMNEWQNIAAKMLKCINNICYHVSDDEKNKIIIDSENNKHVSLTFKQSARPYCPIYIKLDYDYNNDTLLLKPNDKTITECEVSFHEYSEYYQTPLARKYKCKLPFRIEGVNKIKNISEIKDQFKRQISGIDSAIISLDDCCGYCKSLCS